MIIGFIGLGTMGLPMASHLIDQGHTLYVYNRTKAKAQPLADRGAIVCSSPKEVASHVEVIFTMVTADNALREVVLGQDGLIEGAKAGTILIDSSTVSPETSKQVAMACQQHEISMLDAPVSGSEPHAIEGSLTFIVGGEKSLYEKMYDLFLTMGKAAIYMGPQGSGAQTKLAINAIVAINLTALAESLTLATKAGIAPETFLQVVQSGGANSRMAEYKGVKLLNHDFQTQFATSLLLKDLRLAGTMASELAMPTPLLAIVRELMQTAVASGYGDEDMTSILKCYEQWANG